MNLRTITIFILLFLVSGCLSQGNDELSTGQFIGGDKGLELSFVQVPPRVLEGDPFQITLQALNKGESDVLARDALFELSNSQVFGIDDNVQRNENPLLKVTEVGGYGGQTFVVFEDAAYSGGTLSSESPIPITVEACYPYTTLSATDICVARSEFNEVCATTEVKEVQNSGSPVHVSKVEQLLSLLTGDKVRVAFIIHVNKLGDKTDRVYSKSVGAVGGTSCEEKSVLHENEVSIEKITIGQLEYDSKDIENACGGSNFIRLDSAGEGEVQCNFKIHDYVIGTGDYVERMTIQIGYFHDTIANTNIAVIPK